MCTLEKRGRVYLLTLTGNNEHRLNPDLIGAVRSALATVRAQSTSSGGSALVTAAEGRFFSNGFDLAWARSSGSPSASSERLLRMSSGLVALVADLMTLPMPTIAAVTGHAAAAGFMLARSHDYVAMRKERGVIYMSELDIGLPLPDYFTAMMRSKIADPRALRDLLLRASKISATEAVEKGVIDRAYGSAGETIEEAVKLGEELAGRNWNGHVYASIRRDSMPEVCKAVGLVEEEEEVKRKAISARL